MHRLVEIHYHIGLEEEAKKYAKILDIITIQVSGLNNHIKYLNKNYKIENKDTYAKKDKREKQHFQKIIKMIK